jgi:hypothetical protein
MEAVLAIAVAAAAWNAPRFSEDAVCGKRLPGDRKGQPRGLRRRTDRVPIGIVLSITYGFIRGSQQSGVSDDDISNYLHLSKESWGENRREWLQGNETLDEIPHWKWISRYNLVPWTREDTCRLAWGLRHGRANVSHPVIDTASLTLTLYLFRHSLSIFLSSLKGRSMEAETRST